jgi:hypothetical protein
LTLAAIYLSRVGVVGSVFAAALTVRTVVMSPAVEALNIGVSPCWGETCGDMLEAMARITRSQPNDAMARIASRRNRTTSLDPNLPGQNFRVRFFDVDSELFSKVQIDSKEDWARISSKMRVPSHHHHQNPQVYVQPLAAVSAGPPLYCGVYLLK